MKKLVVCIGIISAFFQSYGMTSPDIFVYKKSLAGDAINRSNLGELQHLILSKKVSVYDDAYQDLRQSLVNYAIAKYRSNFKIKKSMTRFAFHHQQTNLQDIIKFLVQHKAPVTNKDMRDALMIESAYKDSTILEILEPYQPWCELQ